MTLNPNAAGANHAALLAAPVPRDCRRAFARATGLDISMLPAAGRVPPGEDVAAEHGGNDGPEEYRPPMFCARMARFHAGCHECLEEERRTAAKLGDAPVVFECFPGLCRVVVPVRAGGALVGTARTAGSSPATTSGVVVVNVSICGGGTRTVLRNTGPEAFLVHPRAPVGPRSPQPARRG